MKLQNERSNSGIRTFIAAFTPLIAATLFSLVTPSAVGAPAAGEKTYAGEWSNRKYKTKGELVCRLTPSNERTWKAKFTGTGLGRPFDYDATLTAGRQGSRIVLQGVSSVDGERYNWSGYINGSSLVGSYRSATGNNGSFSLKVKP